MTERLDVIIFGASGYTGKYTVFEAATVLQNFSWGIAGRNRSKLEAVLIEMGAKANMNLMSIPIIIADVSDESSLQTMAQCCRVLINCCGPYREIGEPVVRACIQSGTHHLDISGEKNFMESMQLKYHAEAQQRNAYVVAACGFDSIPADMGVIYAEQNFIGGVINSVESFLKIFTKADKAATSGSGASVHYGTWDSIINGLAVAKDIRGIRDQIYTEKFPRFKPILKQRNLMFRSEFGDKEVGLPFLGSDRSVVTRSQRFMYAHEQKRPIQMRTYLTLPSWGTAILVALFAIFIGLMAKFSFGRSLLLKHPKFFTFGFVSHEGPSEEVNEQIHFEMTLKALGWSQSEVHKRQDAEQFSEPPTKSLVVKVSGSNPGYGGTCVAMLCCAMTILKESDKMPNTGGVLSPGAAFARTSLISELGKYERGMKFEILNNK